MDCRCENHLKFCSLPKLPALFQTPTFSPKKEKKEGKPWNLAFPTLTHTFLILVGCSLTNFLMLYIFWKVRPRTFIKFHQIKTKGFRKGPKTGSFCTLVDRLRPEPSAELLGIFARLRTFKHCNKAFSQMDLFTAFAKNMFVFVFLCFMLAAICTKLKS